MRGLKSEILFNRALLWLVMGTLTDSTLLRVLFTLAVVGNLVRSCLEAEK